jgi:hypothetical protein
MVKDEKVEPLLKSGAIKNQQEGLQVEVSGCSQRFPSGGANTAPMP